MVIQKLFSSLFYGLIACIFAFSTWLLLILFNPYGWPIKGWNPLQLIFPWNFPERFVILPVLFFLSFFVTLYTLELLVWRGKANDKRFTDANIYYSIYCGFAGVYMTFLGAVLSDFHDPTETTDYPYIWTFYFSMLVILVLLGIYLAWRSPPPKDEVELEEWREYAAQTDLVLTAFTWIVLFLLYIFIFLPIIIGLIAFVELIIPNPVTPYYFQEAVMNSMFYTIIFFPLPFLYIIMFIFHNWKSIQITLDLRLGIARGLYEYKEIDINQRKEILDEKEEERIEEEEKPKRGEERRSEWKALLDQVIILILYPSPFLILPLIYWGHEPWYGKAITVTIILTVWFWVFYGVQRLYSRFTSNRVEPPPFPLGDGFFNYFFGKSTITKNDSERGSQ